MNQNTFRFLSRHDIQMECRIISLPFDIQEHIWKMYFSKYVLNNIPLACWAYNDTFKERDLLVDLQGNPLPDTGKFAWDNFNGNVTNYQELETWDEYEPM